MLTYMPVVMSASVLDATESSTTTTEIADVHNLETTSNLPSDEESHMTVDLPMATTTEAIEESPPIDSTGTSTPSETFLFKNTQPAIPFTIPKEATSTLEEIATSSTLENDPVLDNGELPIGTTTITTGEAVALANILNVTNTTLINSTGSIVLLNIFGDLSSDIDVREDVATTTVCNLLSCNGVDAISAKITSESTIDTTVSLIALSGNNQIATTSTAEITTGDVYAGLNLVNIANTTLVDSHYLLLSLNSFGSISGDIVFPSFSTFFSSGDTTESASSFGNSSTQSSVAIENNLTLGALSGGNTIDNATGSIQTGSTNTSLNIYNNTSTTLLDGSSLLIFLKVTGTWLGNMVGAPTNLHFSNDDTTHLLQMKERKSIDSTLQSTFESTSTAFLSNTVSMIANSGDNSTADTNTSQITTGDAYASANIINIANTHIIGRNWILAIITIFGDFTGDIAFGRPDLWIGEQVTSGQEITNDGELLYTVTVVNKGDRSASKVRITSIYDRDHLDIVSSSEPYTTDIDGNILFLVGSMQSEETKVITFKAKIKRTTPGTKITNIVNVESEEKDNTILDNTDTTTVTTTGVITSSGGGFQYVTPQATSILVTLLQLNSLLTQQRNEDTLHSVAINRSSTSTTLTEQGGALTQTIIIKNPTTVTIPSILFNDILLNATGKIIKTESFIVGDLLPNEEVTLSYSISFGPEAHEGIYQLASEVRGRNLQNIYFANNGEIIYKLKPKKEDLSLQRTATTTLYLTTSNPKKTEPQEQIINSNPFRLARFIETAYAANGQIEEPISTPAQYVFLFAAFSIMRLFRKHPRTL